MTNTPRVSPRLFPRTLTYAPSLSTYLQSIYQDKYPALQASMVTPPRPYSIRINTRLETADGLISKLDQEHITAVKIPLLPDALEIPYPHNPTSIKLTTNKNIIVDKYTAESALQGSHVYVPGVRSYPRFPDQQMVHVLGPHHHHVANGITCLSSRQLATTKNGLAIRNLESPYSLPSLNTTQTYHKGLFYGQSVPGIVTSHLLLNTLSQKSPFHPRQILDLCAAPGGKTTHLIALTQGNTPIVAIDRSINRLKRLQNEITRLDLRNDSISILNENVNDLLQTHPHWQNKFDAILLDPPCSALGVRPKLYDEKKLRELEAAAQYQESLLQSAYELLAPNGHLVYSTCTLSRIENEELIARFLQKNNQPPIDDISTTTLRTTIEKLLEIESDTPVYFRFEPHLHGTTGYFMARLIKSK